MMYDLQLGEITERFYYLLRRLVLTSLVLMITAQWNITNSGQKKLGRSPSSKNSLMSNLEGKQLRILTWMILKKLYVFWPLRDDLFLPSSFHAFFPGMLLFRKTYMALPYKVPKPDALYLY